MRPDLIEGSLTSSVFPPGKIPSSVLEECVRFRTEIYVAEGYLPESEQSDDPDCYDAQSAHFCIRSKNNQLAGYCRMINHTPYTLPIVQLYPELVDRLDTLVEISRFSLKTQWRGSFSPESMAPLFKLAQDLLIFSHQQGIQQWSCLIDERFQKLCQRFFKMKFHLLGEAQTYMGSPSTPCLIDLSESIRNNLHVPTYSTFWETEALQQWIAELEAYER